jgi:predicted metal-dependent phosphoesterase TrpH
MDINPILKRLSSEESSLDLRAVFSKLHAESCPLSFNFHLHTVFSDGRLTPEQLMEQAIALRLQGLAITDHHSVKGYQAAQQWLHRYQQEENEQPLPTLWSGVEITARLLGVDVHILGYGFQPEHPALFPYLLGYTAMEKDYPAQQVIAAIQQAGGLAVLAHPARYKLPLQELIPAAASLGMDGVETYYCYTNPKLWQVSPEPTLEVGQLAQSFGLLQTCGTDTHGADILQRL